MPDPILPAWSSGKDGFVFADLLPATKGGSPDARMGAAP